MANRLERCGRGFFERLVAEGRLAIAPSTLVDSPPPAWQVEDWSLTTLREKLGKIGARIAVARRQSFGRALSCHAIDKDWADA